MCKSPLHGSRNYVGRTCERSANYSARTFSCNGAKPKCNFAVRPLYDRSTMLGRLLQTVWVCFFGEETKTKYCLGICRASMQQFSAKGFLVWRDSGERCVHCNQPIAPTFGRHSCVHVARATAICILLIGESFRSYFLATVINNSVEIAPKKLPSIYTSDKSAAKIDERVLVPSPHVKACDFLSFIEYLFPETLHNNLPVARAKQLGRSLKKTTSCKKATEFPG